MTALCFECGKEAPLTSVAIPEGGTVGRAVCAECVKLPKYDAHVKK
jgi:hypothetical protein